jgi:hypothetical protein
MWLCSLMLDVLGCLIVLAIAGGRGGTTPLGAGTTVGAFAPVPPLWSAPG